MIIDVYLRWSDIDRFGHLNNAVMATLLEEARARFFYSDEIGTGLLDGGIVIAKQTIEYKKPIFYSLDPLQIDVSVARMGNSSFDFAYVVNQGDEKELANGITTMVAIDLQTGKPKRISKQQVEWLRSHL